MANLWRDAVTSKTLNSPTPTITDGSGNVIQFSSCPEYFIPAGSVVFYDAENSMPITMEISTAGLYYPNCAREGNSAHSYDMLVKSSYLEYNDPFYGSVVSIAYSIASSTVVAWLLVILLLISQKKRPLLQIITSIFVAISLTVFLAQATRVLESQYYLGYYDADQLHNKVFGGLTFRVLEVFMTFIVGIASVQVLLRLFQRRKERTIIKIVGITLTLCNTILWCLVNFYVPINYSNNKSSEANDVIPVLAYLFQLSISSLYGLAVLLYSFGKRKYAYGLFSFSRFIAFLKSGTNFLGRRTEQAAGEFGSNCQSTSRRTNKHSSFIIAFLSLCCLSIPIIFFILDICQYWFAGWAEFVRWVGGVGSTVVVWEWVDTIEKAEREEQKNGVLGKQIFEEDNLGVYCLQTGHGNSGGFRKSRFKFRSRSGRVGPSNRNTSNNDQNPPTTSGDSHELVSPAGIPKNTGFFAKARRLWPKPKTHNEDENQFEMSPLADTAQAVHTSPDTPLSLHTHPAHIENPLNPTGSIPTSNAGEIVTANLETIHRQATDENSLVPDTNNPADGTPVISSSNSRNRYWPFDRFFMKRNGWPISRASSTASSTETSSTSYGTQFIVSGHNATGSLSQFMNSTNGIVMQSTNNVVRPKPTPHTTHFTDVNSAPRLYNIQSEQNSVTLEDPASNETQPKNQPHGFGIPDNNPTSGSVPVHPPFLHSRASSFHNYHSFSNPTPYNRSVLSQSSSQYAPSPLSINVSVNEISSPIIGSQDTAPSDTYTKSSYSQQEHQSNSDINHESVRPHNQVQQSGMGVGNDTAGSEDILIPSKLNKYTYPLRTNVSGHPQPSPVFNPPINGYNAHLASFSHRNDVQANIPSDQSSQPVLPTGTSYSPLANIQEGQEARNFNISEGNGYGPSGRTQSSSPTSRGNGNNPSGSTSSLTRPRPSIPRQNSGKGKRKVTGAPTQQQQPPPQSNQGQLHEHYIPTLLPPGTNQPQYIHSLTTNSRAARTASLRRSQSPSSNTKRTNSSGSSSRNNRGSHHHVNTNVHEEHINAGASSSTNEFHDDVENDGNNEHGQLQSSDEEETYRVINNTSVLNSGPGGELICDMSIQRIQTLHHQLLEGDDPDHHDEELPQFSPIPGFSSEDYWDDKNSPAFDRPN